MKKFIFISILAFMFSCKDTKNTIKIETIEYPTYTRSDFDNSIIKLINQKRSEMGLHVLNDDLVILNDLAYSHCEYMIKTNKISHDYFQQRYEQLDLRYNGYSLGEVVAIGYITENGVVSAWLNSESHRKTIFGDYNKIGGATILGNNKKYFCVLLSKSKND